MMMLGTTISLLLLIPAVIATSINHGEAMQDAQKIISDHIHKYYEPLKGGLCEGNTCCNITATESCPITKFAKDTSNLILPGGNTRCIFSSSTPYAFQVIPGDTDNLLFYFQGGGACWDEWSTTTGGFCTTDVAPQSLIGAFDRTNPKNAFKSYTIVHVLYCSGDVHSGNTVRSYNDASGQPVVQVGLVNAQAALDWVQQQVKAGYLASTFSNLVIMGCSAGSIGAQMWGQELLSKLKWQKAAVVPDSYAGVFPDNSLGPLIYDFGFCSSGFLNDALYKKCMNQELTLEALNLDFMTNNPFVPYSFIQSKTDAVQISFYISIATSTNATQKTITPAQFYKKVNDLFADYNTARRNFVTYLVDGDHHCFTPYSLFFEADTKGAEDNGATTSTQLMSDWANQLPLSSGQAIDTRCDGDLQTINTNLSPPDTTYCSSDVVPKEFVEPF
eukprot:gene3221-3433_t